ncbi:hypothetical protein ACYRFS_12990 [Listeria kieliensis]
MKVSLLDIYLKKNGTTRYQIHKLSGIPETTLVGFSKKPLSALPVRALRGVGLATNKGSWEVLKELEALEKELEEKGKLH